MSSLPVFTISLDFELLWGVRDHRTIDDYGQSILGVREVVPALLRLFQNYGIHATWATVGFLFYENREALLRDQPALKPSYANKIFSPYEDIQLIGENENKDPYHFGAELISQIKSTPYQEIGTHTFSHYYCLEEGQTPEQFRADMKAAVKSAQSAGVVLKSIVFPRNQYNEAYLSVVKESGISVYRGNESSWLYEPRNRTRESIVRRVLRMADTYVNISGYHTHDIFDLNKKTEYINIPASRFLRPFQPKLSFLEGLRLRRIKKSMLDAARNNRLFHLWWHPHNFGTFTKENLDVLISILDYYQTLNTEYGMQSFTMAELGDQIYERRQ